MSTTITASGATTAEIDGFDDEPSPGVSWGAILAGAAAAAALSLILLVLGVGLGFSAASPWTASSDHAAALGAATLGWLAFTQIAASALGGYLAGRLRIRWVNVHQDEVWFRDTAHGLLAWAVATLAAAALLGSAVSGVLSGAAQLGGDVAKGLAAAAPMAAGAASGVRGASGRDGSQTQYYVDTLFRADAAPAADPNDAQTRAEALRRWSRVAPASHPLTPKNASATPSTRPARRQSTRRSPRSRWPTMRARPRLTARSGCSSRCLPARSLPVSPRSPAAASGTTGSEAWRSEPAVERDRRSRTPGGS